MYDFMLDALCRDYDPELFFSAAEPGSEVYDRQVAEAKAVCARCPAQAECLAWALDELPFGVAGGLSEDERARLRRQSA